MKQFLKQLFTKNIGWKILSLIAAGVFWLIAVNIIDPTTKRTFDNIPVIVLNETAITSANQVYEIKSGDTVSVTITSKRSLVERLRASDFIATADMAELSSVNAVRIQVKLDKNTNGVAYELDWNNAVMKVTLEERVTSKFKVTVEESGELAEGYVLGTVKAKPNIIEVSGGESTMKKIDHVGVTVQLNGESEGFTTKEEPMAYDSSGDPIEFANLTFSTTQIRVSVGVRRTMDVPVEITTVGEPADGYHLIQTDRQPEFVRISAEDPEKLTDDMVIRLEVDIEGATADVEKEIDISNYFGPDYLIEGGVSVVAVRCEIGRSGQRTLSFTASEIEVLNPPEGYSVAMTDPDTRYQVDLRGSDEKLKNIVLQDLKARINLGSMGEGVHRVIVEFSPPDGVRVATSVVAEVSIIKIENEETPEPEPEPETETEEPEKTSTPEPTEEPPVE